MACYDTDHFLVKPEYNSTWIYRWLGHGATESNFFPVQPHLPLWEGLDSVHWHGLWSVPPSREGYVMLALARWADIILCARWWDYGIESPSGSVLTTTVVGVPLVDMGPRRTSPLGIWSEWPGECHGSRSVLSERRWSTRMGVRGHGFRGVGTVC